jgi:hypothetical protein
MVTCIYTGTSEALISKTWSSADGRLCGCNPWLRSSKRAAGYQNP